MYCPDCGYETDDAVIFCPQCRFQFREAPGEPVPPDKGTGLPGRSITEEESLFEVPRSEAGLKAFTGKELRQMEVQLLQPAVLVVLVIALSSYTVLSAVPFIPVTIAGISLGVTGIVCLVSGLVAGIIFFFLARVWLRKFRYR